MAADKWFLIKAGVVAVSLVLALLLHIPQMVKTFQEWREIERLEKRITEAQSWHVITQRLDKENRLLRQHLQTMSGAAPEEHVQSTTVEFVQQQARQAKLAITSIQPLALTESDNFIHEPINIGLKGRYHAVGRFIHALEAAPDIIRVDYLELSSGDWLTDELNITAQLSLFRLKS